MRKENVPTEENEVQHPKNFKAEVHRETSNIQDRNSPPVVTEKFSGPSSGAETRSSMQGCSKGPSRFDTVEDRSFQGQRSK